MLAGIYASAMMTGVLAQPFWNSDKMLAAAWNQAYYTSAVYDSTANKTYIAWQITSTDLSGNKSIRVTSYDHGSSVWGPVYNAGNFVLLNDDHGAPALEIDHEGYVYVFFGTHQNAQKWSISRSPNDISAWTQQGDLSGAYTYAHPVRVGSSIYFFWRDSADINRRTLALQVGSPSAGSVTFGTKKTIVDFGVDSRFYMGDAHAVGTDVHIIAAWSDAADTVRRGVYYFIYSTIDGSVRNYSGSFSVATGSLPILKASADTNYRVFDHGAGTGEIPSLAFDSVGQPHVIFASGTTPDYDLMHMYHNGTVWSTPSVAAVIEDYFPTLGATNAYSIVPSVDGKMFATYPTNDTLARKTWNGSSWSSEKLLAAAGSIQILDNVSVRNGQPDLRFIFAERAPWTTDAGAEFCRLFAYGDSGKTVGSVSLVGSNPNWQNVVLQYNFESSNNAIRMIDASPMCFRCGSFGNAKIDTTQYKFGSTSLRLDGSGDYISLQNSEALSVVSGDFTIEMWVRLNEVGRLQAFASRRVNSPGGGFLFAVTSANKLLFQLYDSSSAVLANVGTTDLTTGVWYHVAASRVGTTSYLFLDGTLEASGVQSGPVTSPATALLIGRDPVNTSRDFNGWIDDFRMTRSGLYTSSFTPPAEAFKNY